MSHLAKVVLEEQGYEVELQNADLAPISYLCQERNQMSFGCLVADNDERLLEPIRR